MRAIATLTTVFLTLFQSPVYGHTAVQPRYEAQFSRWVRCYKSSDLPKMLTCNFLTSDHSDGISVVCERAEIAIQEPWEWDDPPKLRKPRWKWVPAFTVSYFSYHYPSTGREFQRGSNSPWARECRRVFPGLI